MIEGDNYDALLNLQYTHKGKIDLIYIDPPYNTGNEDFVYNDHYVDKEDSFRHSKWLSFIAPRLVLAKELLADSGVIFISIDDNEQAALKMLLDKIFGNDNLVAVFACKTSGAKQDSGAFAKHHEYIIAYANKSFIAGRKNNLKSKNSYNKVDKHGRKYKIQLLRKWGDKDLREDRPNLYYSIADPDGKAFYPKTKNGEDGRWRWGKEKMSKSIKEGRVEWIKQKDQTHIPYEKVFEDEQAGKPTPFGTLDLIPYSLSGGAELFSIEVFGKFDYPKSSLIIKEILKMGSNKKDCLVLDFFAGSGTTAHAVLDLNAEDGGSRECIVITNNEGGNDDEEKGIARSVCYQRIKKVIQGYEKQTGKKDKVPGLGGSLEYWRTGAKRSEIETEDDWLELMGNLDILALKEKVKFSDTEEDESGEKLIVSGESRSFTISDQTDSDYKLSLNSKAEGNFPGEMIAAYQAAIEIVEEIYLDPVARFFANNQEDKDTDVEHLTTDTEQLAPKESDNALNKKNIHQMETGK